jgi:hypothetical protein
MALSSEIIAKLGLDASGFSSGLRSLPVQVEKFGADASKALARKFSGSDLFRGILQGVGIASVQQVADRLVQPFKESAESSQRIADYSEQAAQSTERLLAARRSDAAQLDALEKQYQRLATEMEKPAEIGFFRSIVASASAMMGLTETSAKLFSNTQANAEKAAKGAADLAAKGLEIEAKKQQMEDKAFDQLMRNYKVRADYVKENRDMVELEAKLLSGRILPAEKARLDILLQQNAVRQNEQRIGEILQKLPVERSLAEQQTLVQLFRQRDVLGNQLQIKQEILNTVLRQEASEKKVTAEQVRQLEIQQQKDQLAGKGRLATEDRLIAGGRVFGPSRDPEEFDRASSSELMELIRRLQADIQFVEQTKGTGLTALADAATGYFVQGSIIARLKTDIQRAAFELGQRNGITADFTRGGEEQARRNFSGDPLQFDEYFSRQGKQIEEQIALLRDLKRLFETGQAKAGVVNLN